MQNVVVFPSLNILLKQLDVLSSYFVHFPKPTLS